MKSVGNLFTTRNASKRFLLASISADKRLKKEIRFHFANESRDSGHPESRRYATMSLVSFTVTVPSPHLAIARSFRSARSRVFVRHKIFLSDDDTLTSPTDALNGEKAGLYAGEKFSARLRRSCKKNPCSVFPVQPGSRREKKCCFSA